MSHRLPKPVVTDLHLLATGVEDRLQSDAYRVGVAVGEHPAFNVRWVETDLTRALICNSACMLGVSRFKVHDLGNGGVELRQVVDGVDRRFRLRRAERDAHGLLRVMSNSDSILTGAAPRDGRHLVRLRRPLSSRDPRAVGTGVPAAPGHTNLRRGQGGTCRWAALAARPLSAEACGPRRHPLQCLAAFQLPGRCR